MPRRRCSAELATLLFLTMLGVTVGATRKTEAAVLCRKKARVTIRDTACKGKETPLNLADFGAVGPQGAQGPMGTQGPPGPTLGVSTSVSGLTPSGSRIVADDDTGLEVTWGANAIATRFVNHNTVPIRLRGVAMYNDANTTFVDFEIAPGGTQGLTVAAVGTQWFDVLAVTRAPVADVRRFRVSCSFVDSGTPAEVAWSCIGTR